MVTASAVEPTSTAAAPEHLRARFDDCRGGQSLIFAEPAGVLAATSIEDVHIVLDQVDRAARAGYWSYGFVSYEAAPAFDSRFRTFERPPGAVPLAWFAVTDAPRVDHDMTRPMSGNGGQTLPIWTPEWDARTYAEMVERARRFIAAGDTYQCNLTTRLHAIASSATMPALYRHMLRRQQPAHAAYLDLGTHVIASASPELFFERSASTVLTRPMKGTARRGRTARADHQARSSLRTDPKQRAENVIIVDLVRNDLARIAQLGSVTVDRLCAVEAYGNVWQMTSDVSATVPAATGLADIFTALFPCGSITGAPKVRTMEIIHELESSPRGIYCGAIGWVAPASCQHRASFNVAIRTAVVERATSRAEYGVGAGITWDSRPADEAAEVDVKSSILRLGTPT